MNSKSLTAFFIEKFLLIVLASFLFTSCKVFQAKKVNTTIQQKQKPVVNNNIEADQSIVNIARAYYGVPYRTAGNDANGFDCSGLMCNVFQKVGYKLPRISQQQAEIGEDVDILDLKIGDLVFFNTNKNNSKINHVGLVTVADGEGQTIFIHASTSKGVKEDFLSDNYWKKAFIKATRPFVF